MPQIGVKCSTEEHLLVRPTERAWERDRETTKFCGLFSPRAELQSLVATKIRKIDSFKLKGAMMKGVEETLAEVVNMGFRNVNTGAKYACFRFIEM